MHTGCVSVPQLSLSTTLLLLYCAVVGPIVFYHLVILMAKINPILRLDFPNPPVDYSLDLLVGRDLQQ